jgi:hypothetical protein
VEQVAYNSGVRYQIHGTRLERSKLVEMDSPESMNMVELESELESELEVEVKVHLVLVKVESEVEVEVEVHLVLVKIPGDHNYPLTN